MADITQILQAIDQGEVGANERLLAIVYAELRAMAASQMSSERPGHTLVPTALVHEAYIRLMGSADAVQFETRGHFFGAVAEVMRRILIDHARRKNSQKRGGRAHRLDLPIDRLPAQIASDQWLELDEALSRLEQTDPEVARLVKLRYFAGLTINDAAQSLGISARTAVSWWTYARTWLAAELSRDPTSA